MNDRKLSINYNTKEFSHLRIIFTRLLDKMREHLGNVRMVNWLVRNARGENSEGYKWEEKEE